MSEAAMMLLSGKPAAKGQGATENARQGEAGAQSDGVAPPQLFGGLLLKMLNTDGEQAALQLPPAATAGEQSGNSLPSESPAPAVAWSALMVWDELPRPEGQTVLSTGQPGTMLSRDDAQVATNFLIRQANPLQQGMGGDALSQVTGSTLQKSDELFNQNLLKLLTEQTGNRVIDPRQPVTLLAAAESTETGLNGSLSQNTGSINTTSQQGQFNQLLAGLGGMNSAAGQRPEMQLPPMTVAPQHPNWSNGIGERIQWMVGQNMQQAEIRLEPPELGSLELRVTINRDQASLSITAANAQVRDAVEAAAPRLREMFGEVGLDLGDVNVSQESFAEQQQTGDNPDGQGQGLARGDEPGSEGDASIVTGESRVNSGDNGLLDLYA